MSEHPNAAMVRRSLDAFNRGETEDLVNLIADDVEWHEIGRAEPLRGKAALVASMAAAQRDYTISVEVHDVLADDEHTVALAKATATRGDRTLTYQVAEIYHLRDGKIIGRWAFSDDTGAITAFFA